MKSLEKSRQIQKGKRIEDLTFIKIYGIILKKHKIAAAARSVFLYISPIIITYFFIKINPVFFTRDNFQIPKESVPFQHIARWSCIELYPREK